MTEKAACLCLTNIIAKKTRHGFARPYTWPHRTATRSDGRHDAKFKPLEPFETLNRGYFLLFCRTPDKAVNDEVMQVDGCYGHQDGRFHFESERNVHERPDLK